MKIKKVFKRVGDSLNEYEYLVEIDLETDVTKYGQDKIVDRYVTGVYPLEILENATNFNLFETEISKCDYIWWKANFNEEFSHLLTSSKFIYRYGRVKLRKFILKIFNFS